MPPLITLKYCYLPKWLHNNYCTLKLRNLFCSHNCTRKRFKRYLQDTRVRRISLILLVIFCIAFYFFGVKIPKEKSLKAKEVTAQITSVLKTRITAVRLLPDKNTTKLQPPFLCHDDLFAVILIKSTPDKYWKRQIIRNTWLKFIPQLKEKVVAFFFMGVPSETDITMNLTYESDTFNDIIIEDDLDENHYLQTLKSLRLLKWFNSSNSCLNARFLIRTDDDSFLHMPNIVDHINFVPNAWVNYIGGDQLHLMEGVNSDPDSKHFSPSDWWSESIYPPYVTGPLVVFAAETVPLLLSASLTVPMHHLEDVFLIGMVGYEKCRILPKAMPGIEFNSPHWMVRIKMALSIRDLAKTNLAFYCAGQVDFIQELYEQAVS